EYRVRRKIGLHDDGARQVRASGATAYLRQQRCESFGRAKISAVKRVVSAEHADQRETWKIVPLRQHLRSHQEINRLLRDLRTHGGEGPFGSRAVAIDAHDSRVRERLRQRAFEPLRSIALREQIDVAALGTCARQCFLMAAVMA